jgi:hypothetical protein
MPEFLASSLEFPQQRVNIFAAAIGLAGNGGRGSFNAGHSPITPRNDDGSI